jgi:UDP-2,3-diacylglucosamine pyrophosphatase LpxH
VHLGGFEAEENARLEQDAAALIRYCTTTGIDVVIHGDLFDFWMEYPGRIPDLGRPVREAVKAHAVRFGPVRMVTGNHDNWMLGGLVEEGFEPEAEFLRLSLDGRQVLVLHGDGLADPAFGFPRPRWHRFIRHGAFLRIFRFLPYAWALGIMRWVSIWRRRRGPDPAETRRLDAWVEAGLRSGLADVVIAGHHHETTHRQIAGSEYLNPGAFHLTRTAVLHTGSGFHLVVWNATESRLEPFHD